MNSSSMDIVGTLVQQGWLKSPHIIDAFKKIKREDFLSEDMRRFAELNEPLPIGYGQTISQPLTVAFMLELLNPQRGNKILDIGAGSGWTTALMAYIVSHNENSQIQSTNHKSQTANGKVIAIEIIPELKEFGERNVAKYNFIQRGLVEFLCIDGSRGYKKEAPYDRILSSAAGTHLPRAWQDQVVTGGRIVAPIGSSLWLFVKVRKEGKETFEKQEFPGFSFVPLVEGS